MHASNSILTAYLLQFEEGSFQSVVKQTETVVEHSITQYNRDYQILYSDWLLHSVIM